MKNKEEIINDSIKLEIPPEDYNLLEIHCFLSLKQLLIMFHNNYINKENATRTKKLILAEYESKRKQYNFERNLYLEYIQSLKNTEEKRIELKKILNDNTEITEARLCETISICMEIIYSIFKGEFEEG